MLWVREIFVRLEARLRRVQASEDHNEHEGDTKTTGNGFDGESRKFKIGPVQPVFGVIRTQGARLRRYLSANHAKKISRINEEKHICTFSSGSTFSLN